MNAIQMWERLDTPGSDVARLLADGSGWRLEGRAVFLSREGPTSVGYRVGIDADWRTRWGEVVGFAGERTLQHRIERGETGWSIDGMKAAGLEDLADLDFGFTPATNLQQIRRLALGTGQEGRCVVAWFDVENGGSGGLQRLDQTYRRTGETTYDYASPQGDYSATLTMGESGFCIDYPGLWRGVS